MNRKGTEWLFTAWEKTLTE